MRHKVCINVAANGIRSPVLTSSTTSIKSRVFRWLFGEDVGVVVMTPGKTVETVEIRELPKIGGEPYE